MKNEPSFQTLTAVILTGVLSCSVATAQPETRTVETKVGTLEYVGGYPTADTAQKLYDELDYQRAVQSYLWALPMASYGAFADAHYAEGAGDHAVLVADNSAEPQQLILTANQDTIYMSGALDLSKGPMVLDVPAGLLGTMNNIWQQPLVDIGGPFSPEQNRGGRFLILPPGYQGPMPAIAYHVVKSDTNTVVFYPSRGSSIARGLSKTPRTGTDLSTIPLVRGSQPAGDDLYLDVR